MSLPGKSTICEGGRSENLPTPEYFFPAIHQLQNAFSNDPRAAKSIRFIAGGFSDQSLCSSWVVAEQALCSWWVVRTSTLQFVGCWKKHFLLNFSKFDGKVFYGKSIGNTLEFIFQVELSIRWFSSNFLRQAQQQGTSITFPHLILVTQRLRSRFRYNCDANIFSVAAMLSTRRKLYQALQQLSRLLVDRGARFIIAA